MKSQAFNDWLREDRQYSKKEIRGMLSLICELISCYTVNGRNPTVTQLIKDVEKLTGISGIRPWEKMHINLPFYKERKSFDETIREIKANMTEEERRTWEVQLQPETKRNGANN